MSFLYKLIAIILKFMYKKEAIIFWKIYKLKEGDNDKNRICFFDVDSGGVRAAF